MATNFRDDAGIVRLDGTLYAPGATVGDVLTVQADGSLAPEAGGGSPPITREALYGNTVTITNGSGGNLTLDTSLGPDSLLDISTPDTPTVITAGTYAFTVGSSVGGSMTAGGGYDLTLAVDTAGENALTVATVAAGVHVTNPHASVTVVYHCPAGAAIAVQVNNNDGVQGLDFSVFELIVQRLA